MSFASSVLTSKSRLSVPFEGESFLLILRGESPSKSSGPTSSLACSFWHSSVVVSLSCPGGLAREARLVEASVWPGLGLLEGDPLDSYFPGSERERCNSCLTKRDALE